MTRNPELSKANRRISELEQQIEAMHQQAISMGETNMAMGRRLLAIQEVIRSNDICYSVEIVSEIETILNPKNHE